MNSDHGKAAHIIQKPANSADNRSINGVKDKRQKNR